MNNRSLFLQHLAQTSEAPMALEITHAKDCNLFDADGKKYIDLIGGISVSNIGHGNPKVLAAIQEQAAKYLHVMVYGETVQTPQVQYAEWLVAHLPNMLNNVYFTNSGAEATEGAMKLAKRYTQKTKFVSCYKSYHGHTQGALSIMGDEYWKTNFRPLLPNCFLGNYNNQDTIDLIDEDTAAIFIEPVQAESGVIKAEKDWLLAIREKCNTTGTLLIFDEIQSGFGRTGKLWAFEHYNIIPDILLLGKALGGGLPMGAFISNKKIMHSLAHTPVLGHLTTFGGHPLCCAAGLAAAKELETNNWIAQVAPKEKLFLENLTHTKIKNINHAGLWMAVEFESFEYTLKVIEACLRNGLFTDWFLFASNMLRIAPPFIISEAEIIAACAVINNCLDGI